MKQRVPLVIRASAVDQDPRIRCIGEASCPIPSQGSRNDTGERTFGAAHSKLASDDAERLIVRAGRRLLKGGTYLMDSQVRSGCAVPEISHSEAALEELLGEGSFAAVYSVSRLENSTGEKKGNYYSCGTSERSRLPPADRVVVKTLRKALTSNMSLFATCAADLVKEGLLLSCLPQHQHLVQVYGKTPNGIHAYMDGYHDAFFLVLEKLETTLTEKLLEWRQLKSRRVLAIPSILARQRKNMKLAMFQERVQVMSDLASVVAHLHSHSVIHRDLKPDNIGFDHNGMLKLFDLDVARIIPGSASQRCDSDTFHLTKRTGTLGYMSPECYRGDLYNEKSDVYSYTILAYEVYSLIEPFHHVAPEQRDNRVSEDGLRPLLSKSWPMELQLFFRRGWKKSHLDRPTMKEAGAEWNSLIPKLLADKERKYSKYSWRSTADKESVSFQATSGERKPVNGFSFPTAALSDCSRSSASSVSDENADDWTMIKA